MTQPKDNSGGAEGTTTCNYNHATTPAGGLFLPSSVATSPASCASMKYDAGGRMTDSYTGLPATGANDTCAGDESGKHNHIDYYSDSDSIVERGNLPCSAYGPEANESDIDGKGNWTWYTSGVDDAQDQAPRRRS